MGFAEEVKNAQDKGMGAVEAMFNLPEGGKPEVVPETKVEEKKPEEVVAEVKKEETIIKIGSKEFKTHAEALAYAQELEQATQLEDAYRKGIKDAAPEVVEPKIDEEELFLKQIEDKLFENPKEALKLYGEKLVQKVTKNIEDTYNKKNQEEKFWSDFTLANPDLNQETVKYILQRDWKELGYIDVNKAKDELAKRTRSYINNIVEQAKPKTELPKTNTTLASASNGALPVTENPKVESLDFISQLNKMRFKS